MFGRFRIKQDDQQQELSHCSNKVTLVLGTKRKRHDYEPSACLNPIWKTNKEQNYLCTPPISDDNTKKSLLQEYHKQKRTRLKAR